MPQIRLRMHTFKIKGRVRLVKQVTSELLLRQGITRGGGGGGGSGGESSLCARWRTARRSIPGWCKLRTCAFTVLCQRPTALGAVAEHMVRHSSPPATWPSLGARGLSREAGPGRRGWGERTRGPGGVRLRAVGRARAGWPLKAVPRPACRASLRGAQARRFLLVSRSRVRASGSVAAAAAAAAPASHRHHERLQQRGARRALHPRVPSLPQ